MSLNKTLDRLFDEIRREAKRNPDFANRLDAALRLHGSRREVPDEVVAAMAREPSSPAASSGRARRDHKQEGASPRPAQSVSSPAQEMRQPALSPVGMLKREGEAALLAALAAQELGALRSLVLEHNLDPSGVTSTLTRDELAAHVVAQAKRRAQRDDQMFDY